jgi:HSP20 family protein
MALIRWEPTRELATIQNEMNRLFSTFFDESGRTGGTTGGVRRWIPAMDLVESENDFILRADLPGLSEGDVNIELEDNVLTISGERKAAHEDRKEGYYRVERAYGAFSRSLTLPEGIDPGKVQASFDRGVLQVTIPKPEQRKPRKVTIAATPATGNLSGGETTTNTIEGSEHAETGTESANHADPVGASA